MSYCLAKHGKLNFYPIEQTFRRIRIPETDKTDVSARLFGTTLWRHVTRSRKGTPPPAPLSRSPRLFEFGLYVCLTCFAIGIIVWLLTVSVFGRSLFRRLELTHSHTHTNHKKHTNTVSFMIIIIVRTKWASTSHIHITHHTQMTSAAWIMLCSLQSARAQYSAAKSASSYGNAESGNVAFFQRLLTLR